MTAAIKKKLDRYSKASLIRRSILITDRDQHTAIINGKPCVNFCSNDYLGLSSHEAIKKACIEGVERYGVGSASSPAVSGYFAPQQQLEETFAEFLNRDKAIFFNSGYLANLGVMMSLADRSSTIISDKFCHSSLLDGIQLSRAKHYRFSHRDVNHLQLLMDSKKSDLLVTESVFSMEGSIAPLAKIISLAKPKSAIMVVDDAHGIGVLGENGGGICEALCLSQDDVPCLITPLGKAFASMGAVVSGRGDLIEAVLQFSRSYRYTTALPPAICAATLKAIDIIQTERWRREILNERINFFISAAKKKALVLSSYDLTPIKCLIVSDNHWVQLIQGKMIDKGFFVSCIRPPTVPVGTARIRISLNYLHSEKTNHGFVECS